MGLLSRVPTPRNQRIGIILTAVLVVGSIVAFVCISHSGSRPSADLVASDADVSLELLSVDSMARARRDSAYRARYADHRRHGSYPSSAAVAPKLFDFDPNTADSVQLVSLGLKPWQARNVIRYRQKGRFRSADQFRKIYGLTDEQFDRLLPHIVIDTAAIAAADAAARAAVASAWQADGSQIAEAASDGWIVKRDTILDLNTADTTELRMLCGIGSYYAKAIIDYRRRLGGYHSVDQLMEVRGMRATTFDQIAPMLVVDTARIVPIRVNTAKAGRLRSHPYINAEAAAAIEDLRHRRFRLKSLDQLRAIPELDEQTLERIRPYLSFE